MILLLLDTSGPDAGVALLQDGKTLYAASKRHENTHSESILPMTDEALSALGLSIQDIDLFAAVTGPGSFTGVRIGVSTVRGFSHVTGKPCVAVNSLCALAARFPFEEIVYPLLDARRSQVYAAAFKNSVRFMEDCALSVEELMYKVSKDKPALFVGDGASVNRDAILAYHKLARFAPAHMNRLCPEAAAHLAFRDVDKSGSYLDLRPLYLRAPQAERDFIAGRQCFERINTQGAL